MAGLGGPRQSSRLLRQLPRGSQLPWQRVVSATGKLADFANAKKQKRLLEEEGVTFTDKGRIPKDYYI